MATAPKVQTLAESMAMLEPAYAEQRGLINEQMEGLGAASDVRRERLEGAKTRAFDQINAQARGRGSAVAMGGIPLHEQAEYLSFEYLPGMQDIEMLEGQERMQLRGQIADINKESRTTALSRIDQQQQSLNQWNLQQAQIEAQRREAELHRRFTTSERIASQQFASSERVATQQFTASQNAANRAASAASAGPAGLTSGQAKSALLGLMTGGNRRGADGYVSPDAYRRIASQAYAAGIDPDSYAILMGEFINPKHASSYTI